MQYLSENMFPLQSGERPANIRAMLFVFHLKRALRSVSELGFKFFLRGKFILQVPAWVILLTVPLSYLVIWALAQDGV